MELSAWFWPVLLAPFIGSFLGVLVARLPSGGSVVWGRSVCAHCGHPLAVADLVPIASWIALRGRCRYCDARIAPWVPAIELGALGVALWAASVADGAMLWASCVLGWTLLALAAIDFRDEVLPDMLTLPLLALGLVVNYLDDPARLSDCVIGAAAGFLVFAAIRGLYQRWRGREGLGLGDAKLLAASGAWLAWDGLPSVVLIAALLGLAAALVAGLRGHRIAIDHRLAFGPALCLATWLVWLYGPLG